MDLKEPEKSSFELTRVEFLSEGEKNKLIEETGEKLEEGLVVIEKTANSYPKIQLHYIGNKGITQFMKEVDSRS